MLVNSRTKAVNRLSNKWRTKKRQIFVMWQAAEGNLWVLSG